VGQFGSVESTTAYEINADVFLADLRWFVTDRTELYFNLTYSLTDGKLDALAPRFASDVPVALFPDGLPGDGDDPTAPVRFADYEGLAEIDAYSELDYKELRAILGARWEINEQLGIFGQISHYDLDDGAPYLQDATGTVTLAQAGISWYF
jgi:hypothetical protein